jgi:endonuclease G
LVLTVALLRGCAARPRATKAPEAQPAAAPSSPHLALGLPTDGDQSDDVILDEHDFVVSFNPSRMDPNWVAWQLDSRYFGAVRRRDDFRADESLSAAAARVTPHDYQHSGYDRGHLCPSADRTATEEMNSLTFLMTNMVPQVHEVNRGPWERLEEHERDLAKRTGAELYIVAGPIFDAAPKTIGRGVAVPRATYKVIVALSAGQNAMHVTNDTMVVSVVIPNEERVSGHPWTEFTTSVDEVERQSGYDFLNAVPDDVEAALEAKTGAQ